MLRFFNWFITLIVAALILLLVVLGSASEKSSHYRPATPKEFIQHYQTQALEEMIGALQKAAFSAEISEALKCPCYDIETSTQGERVTIIRIDKGNCPYDNKDNEKGKSKD